MFPNPPLFKRDSIPSSAGDMYLAELTLWFVFSRDLSLLPMKIIGIAQLPIGLP
jgi:hypothetical protein